MIDTEKIKPFIKIYKEHFSKHWEDEKYKWEAVKHFQDNWDINAKNFGEMFEKATDKTYNLLASLNNFPRAMIIELAKADDNAVREMFVDLFDENNDISTRIENFRKSAESIRSKYDNGTWKNHYQSINSISTYLWLKYPDKYYIYKYGLYKNCAERFDDSYRPKANGAIDNVIGGYKMYDEIRDILMADEEMQLMFHSVLTESCYPDNNFITATIDFGFYLADYFYDTDTSWFPKLNEYDPGLSVENWKDLLNDPQIFDENSMFVMNAFLDIGGEATCKELSNEYGKDPGFYNIVSSKLAKRIHDKTDCPLVKKEMSDNSKWWPILYQGKQAGSSDDGVYIWKLRNNLKIALSNMNDKSVDNEIDNSIDAQNVSNSEFLKYFTPLIQAIKELGGSATRKEAHEKVIEIMDITEEELSITYEKTGASRVINQIDFARNDLAHEGFISNETKGVWALTELGMNTEMTLELAGHIHMKWVKINAAKRKGQEIPNIDLSKFYIKKKDHKYTKNDFLKEVFITETEYNKLRSLVLRKQNIILQGSPGVGKTFSAERLAYSIIGEKNENRICKVQFHQNYSYEDFIMGYRPNDNGGFELQSGVFYNFCLRCKENPDKPYFFIIDEINRGNLSKIFGELLMLIETDKRGEKHKLNLVYGGKPFYVPENLHIIGMMNTADRSLAMIDYALRRRFSFYTMKPAFDSADENGFGDYMKNVDCGLYHSIVDRIKLLNEVIRKDTTLGKGFEIGHSYFAPENASDINDEWVRNVVEFEVMPLIEEYWFDNEKKLNEQINILRQMLGE